jgi:hypothetical protein
MSNIKDQYNHDTTGLMPPPAEKETATSVDAKVRKLEEQLAMQAHDIVRLHKDINKLKDAVDSLESTVFKLKRG